MVMLRCACHAGNVMDSIKAARQQRVRVSIVGLAAEVHICKVVAQVRGEGGGEGCVGLRSSGGQGGPGAIRGTLRSC